MSRAVTTHTVSTSSDSSAVPRPRPWGQRLHYRALKSRRIRAALAIAGVAASTLLFLVLLASYHALSTGVASYTGQSGLDLWLTPRGTDNLIRSSGLMPAEIVERARVRGVVDTAPLVRVFVRAENVANADVRPINLLAIGYRAPGGLGGPPALRSGRAPRGEQEVAVDRAAAYRLAVRVGERIRLNGIELRVVGLTSGTNLLATQFVFVDEPLAERLGNYVKQVSFVAVTLEPGARVSDVRARLGQLDAGLSVHTRADFVTNNLAEVTAGFRPLQILVSGVGMLVSAALIALLIQSAVDDKKRDIAVLLAMGASVRRVAAAALAHAVLLVLIGSALGALAAAALEAAAEHWFPTAELELRVSDVVLALSISPVVSMAAAAWPLLRLRRIDPVEAFRA
jgi:putative ABC transport system permease protein